MGGSLRTGTRYGLYLAGDGYSLYVHHTVVESNTGPAIYSTTPGSVIEVSNCHIENNVSPFMYLRGDVGAESRFRFCNNTLTATVPTTWIDVDNIVLGHVSGNEFLWWGTTPVITGSNTSIVFYNNGFDPQTFIPSLAGKITAFEKAFMYFSDGISNNARVKIYQNKLSISGLSSGPCADFVANYTGLANLSDVFNYGQLRIGDGQSPLIGHRLYLDNSNIPCIQSVTSSSTTGPLKIQPLGGYVMLPQTATYANDAAAGAGGVTSGSIYKTSAGVLMIKL
jgi:hypothetical protein